MLKLTITIGPDLLALEGDVTLADVLPLVEVWIDALPHAVPDFLGPRLDALTVQGGQILMGLTAMQAALDAINVATNNIAADLAGLKTLVGTGMSQADVDLVQSRLDASQAALEALAAETPDAP